MKRKRNIKQKNTRGSLHKGYLGEVLVVAGTLAVVDPQKEEVSEDDHLELHYAVQPQKTKANVIGTNP